MFGNDVRRTCQRALIIFSNTLGSFKLQTSDTSETLWSAAAAAGYVVWSLLVMEGIRLTTTTTATTDVPVRMGEFT